MEEELVARREKRQRIIKQHMGDPPREERPMEVKDLVKGFAEVGWLNKLEDDMLKDRRDSQEENWEKWQIGGANPGCKQT